MKSVFILILINILITGGVLSKTSNKKTRKLKIKSSHKLLKTNLSLPKNINTSLKISYTSGTLQSTSAPYRVGVLNSEGININPLIEYRYNSLLSISMGPSINLSRKSGEEGFFHSDVTKLSYKEYKLETLAFLNLSTGQTLFRPYLKASVGFAQFDLGFSKDKEGFSDLNDSIASINGKGLVSEFGVGAEVYLYKGLGFFSELSYKSFDVKKVSYDIQGDLAEYEQSLVSSEKGSRFSGLSILYGMAFRF